LAEKVGQSEHPRANQPYHGYSLSKKTNWAVGSIDTPEAGRNDPSRNQPRNPFESQINMSDPNNRP
jgi:hypothetical protein